jgi:uncharacterized protein (TIGR03083 family)
MRSVLWADAHTERAALVDDLTGQTHLDWTTPSLCDGWDVGDIVAHLAATATLSRWNLAQEFLRAGFSADRIAERQINAARKRSPAARPIRGARRPGHWCAQRAHRQLAPYSVVEVRCIDHR